MDLRQCGIKNQETLRRIGELNKLALSGNMDRVKYEKANIELKYMPDVVARAKSARGTIRELRDELRTAEYNSNWNKASAINQVISGLKKEAEIEFLANE